MRNMLPTQSYGELSESGSRTNYGPRRRLYWKRRRESPTRSAKKKSASGRRQSLSDKKSVMSVGGNEKRSVQSVSDSVILRGNKDIKNASVVIAREIPVVGIEIVHAPDPALAIERGTETGTETIAARRRQKSLKTLKRS